MFLWFEAVQPEMRSVMGGWVNLQAWTYSLGFSFKKWIHVGRKTPTVESLQMGKFKEASECRGRGQLPKMDNLRSCISRFGECNGGA